MSKPSNYRLPHGAKGFDLGEAVLVFANDKICVTSKTARDHLTLHFGPHSQTIDIHQKYTSTDGSVAYTRLFTISHANLSKMLQEIAPVAMDVLMGLLRPLRPGWMAKSRVGAIIGLVPMESDLPLVTKLCRRKLVVDPEKLAAKTWAPEFLEDLYDLPDGQPFTLFSCKDPNNSRMIGVGFKFTDPAGQRHLVWFKNRKVSDVFKRVGTLLQNIAAKYGTFHKPLPWF